MNCNQLEKYLSDKKKSTVAEAQIYFSSEYKEMRKAFAFLESKSVIRPYDEISYVYCKTQTAINLSVDQDEKTDRSQSDVEIDRDVLIFAIGSELKKKPQIYKEVLKCCVKQKTISRSLLRYNLSIGYTLSAEIYEWLKKMKIITERSDYSAKVTITEEELAKILHD